MLHLSQYFTILPITAITPEAVNFLGGFCGGRLSDFEINSKMSRITSITTLLLALLGLIGCLGVHGPTHLWKGYSPHCRRSCEEQGEVCDENTRFVCCSKGKCIKKYGLSTCTSPLLTFACDPAPTVQDFEKVFSPNLYPNLYNKP